MMGTLFLFYSIIAFIIINEEIIFEFIYRGLCGYGIGLIFGALPHIIKENLNKSDAAEAYLINRLRISLSNLKERRKTNQASQFEVCLGTNPFFLNMSLILLFLFFFYTQHA